MSTVVILEEEPFVARALARDLQHFGLTSTIVTDATAAASVLELAAPQLLVADLWTGGRKGVDVLAMARDAFPHVRRCILSGSIHELGLDQLERIRPCALLRKPWTRDEVGRLVRED